MRSALVLVLSVVVPAHAFERMAARESELGRKGIGVAPDPALGGELPRPRPPSNIHELRTSIAEKARALEQVQKNYTATVALKSAEPAICALYKIGLAYEHFSDAMSHMPIPPDAPDDMLAQIRDRTDPLKARAIEALTAAAVKGEELAIDNACRAAAVERLRSRYKVERFPVMGEDVPELKLAPQIRRDEGEGPLREIAL